MIPDRSPRGVGIALIIGMLLWVAIILGILGMVRCGAEFAGGAGSIPARREGAGGVSGSIPEAGWPGNPVALEAHGRSPGSLTAITPHPFFAAGDDSGNRTAGNRGDGSQATAPSKRQRQLDDFNHGEFYARGLKPSPAGGEMPARYLIALAAVESGGNDQAHGRAGERGRYQFKRVAWTQANRIAGTRYPFSGATNRAVATYLAGVYLGWLNSHLTPAGGHSHGAVTVLPEPAALFCAWNLGPTGFSRRGFNLHNCPRETREAALRFRELVEETK
jgi:hypothetical protein